MSAFASAYIDLLIKQYWEQPNARAEIGAAADRWEPIRDLMASFPAAFDVDIATGDQLDIIGRIVGMPREVPYAVPKVAFGFADNPNGRRFDDKFISIAGSAPFQDRFAPTYTALTLDDHDYRLFIRATIARNNGSAYLISDTRTSIQETVAALFEGQAYVLDRRDMSLALYISPVFELDRLRVILGLGLLPKPQGVRYDVVMQAAPGETFGFADNPNALGFADRFDAAQVGGRFALKVIL
jgi:hypothetical protein